MAVENFKSIIWSTSIFMSYDEAMVMRPLMNRKYEGEIQSGGEKVKILEIGDMSATAYTGTVAFSELDDAAKFLEIDQKYYIAPKLDNVDKVQANVSLLEEMTRKMGIGMARNMDQFLTAKVSEAGIVSGTTSSPIEITSANITSYFSDVALALDEANAPAEGRVAVVPAWMKEKLVLAKITKDTDNSATLTSGYIGNYLGFEVYMSNNVTKSGSAWYKPMFFIRNETIAFAEQLVQVKAVDLESSFGDGLKMLAVYGAKVVRPSTLKTIICAPGAES